MKTEFLHACLRFGLGPTLSDLDKNIAEPRDWLITQLYSAYVPHAFATLQDNTATENLYLRVDEARRQERLENLHQNQKPSPNPIYEAYVSQTATRIAVQLDTEQPFIERLVMFWANHFTVSVNKPRIFGLVYPFEVQAIRPHVTGRFADMLLAVTQHPAMLLYLDNATSFGPHSVVGLKQHKSYNENLGREILELHTLGVEGGYTQEDVIALAKILTGWSLTRENQDIIMRFAFQAAIHEPGAKTLLSQTYAEGGMDEGINALTALARHPATAKHIATKIAQHFIADSPPPEAVDTLSRIFLDTDGNLLALYQTLIQIKQAWQEPLTKFKNNYDFLLSVLRLNQIKLEEKQIMGSLRAVNALPYTAPSPAGLGDNANLWSSADNILKRVEWVKVVAEKIPNPLNAAEIASNLYGQLLNESSRSVIEGAASARDALAFLLASPEFQRR